MKAIVLLIAITFYLGLVLGNPPNKKPRMENFDTCQKCGLPYGNRGINAGASTSSSQDTGRCQRCEIQNYVAQLIFMMTAEDRAGHEDLTFAMNARPEEMEAFHDYVTGFIRNAGLGPNRQYENSELDRTARLDQFYMLLEQLSMEVIQLACTEQYNINTHYRYNKHSNKINVYREYRANGCVCTNPNCERERLMTDYPLEMPNLGPTEQTSSMIWINDNLERDENMLYYIIPPRTITRFFQTWLRDDTSINPGHSRIPTPQNQFNGCAATLLKRLKRSVQKLIMVSIRKSQVYSDRPATTSYPGNNDEILSPHAIQNSLSWMGGNMYIAPINRGPFLPTFQRSESDLDNAFDHEARPIIGERRYQELIHVFEILQEFNNLGGYFLPCERLIWGFKIYAAMTLAFGQHGVTPYRSDNWEYRILSYEELEDIVDQAVRESLRGQKFFTTKKFNERQKRSVIFDEIKATQSEELKFRRQWRDFTLDMMRVTMEDRTFNQSLPWLCQFNRLYDQYLLQKSDTFEDECLNCLDFDEFLFSNILQPNNWTKCGYTKNNDVCSAWHNVSEIMDRVVYQNSDKKLHSNFYESEYHRVGKPNWETYLQHMGTIVNWLSSPVSIAEKIIKTDEIEIIPTNFVSYLWHNGIVNTARCAASVIVPFDIVFNNGCLKLGRS